MGDSVSSGSGDGALRLLGDGNVHSQAATFASDQDGSLATPEHDSAEFVHDIEHNAENLAHLYNQGEVQVHGSPGWRPLQPRAHTSELTVEDVKVDAQQLTNAMVRALTWSPCIL